MTPPQPSSMPIPLRGPMSAPCLVAETGFTPLMVVALVRPGWVDGNRV
jgi:hypothetical protein